MSIKYIITAALRAGIILHLVSQGVAQQVTSFTLINAATDTEIRPIINGDTINLSNVGNQLSIRAVTSGTTLPGSVRFDLDGVPNYRTENVSPFALGGDVTGNYFSVANLAVIGSHTVSATPFPGPNQSGTPGTTLTILINVIAVAPTPPPNTDLRITGLVLIDATTDQVIGPLNNGNTIIGAAMNIQANVAGSVESVVFGYDTNIRFQTEDVAPYAFAGNINRDYFPFTFQLGRHTVTATPYSQDGGSGIRGSSLSVTFDVVISTITGFVLINATTDQVIGPLVNGNRIIGAATNIRADVAGSVESVVFGYDTNSSFRTENAAPYAFAGDINGDYFPFTFQVGQHRVSATPYSQDGGSGISGTSRSVTFTVV